MGRGREREERIKGQAEEKPGLEHTSVIHQHINSSERHKVRFPRERIQSEKSGPRTKPWKKFIL